VAAPAQRLIDEGADAREIAATQLRARHPVDVEDGDVGNNLSHYHRPILPSHFSWGGAVWKDHRPSSLGWPFGDSLIPPVARHFVAKRVAGVEEPGVVRFSTLVLPPPIITPRGRIASIFGTSIVASGSARHWLAEERRLLLFK
jgi:hypothetical protein